MASFSLTEEDVLRCCRSKCFTKELASASPFSDLHHAIQSARRIWFNKVVPLPPSSLLSITLADPFPRLLILQIDVARWSHPHCSPFLTRVLFELLSTAADDLFPLFDRYGKVIDVFIPRDRRYKYADEAQKVLHNIAIAEYFHWNMLRNLAGIYYEQSQLDMAILHYKQAINCDSTFIEAYNNLGNALKDAGHVEEAINFYRSCLALQPNHPQALSSLGSIYMDCNMMSVAASFYKATLAVTTGISAPFNNLAIIYKQQTAAGGLVNRRNTFKEIGRVTEAIQDYIRAVNIRPTMPEAHANLASAYKDSLQISSTPELKLMKCGLSGLNAC
ncbi:hypothetical protein ZIOFF_073370 [Zingiber officinale]|uniref:Uncharacterized protein n=1 Tax=Zingiber officinale TaxID=94328 RepID=A0A8J5C968_ZINOF|nr:hypothetical protein ZIOFF_073370 [Zingiber officinale]